MILEFHLIDSPPLTGDVVFVLIQTVFKVLI